MVSQLLWRKSLNEAGTSALYPSFSNIGSEFISQSMHKIFFNLKWRMKRFSSFDENFLNKMFSFNLIIKWWIFEWIFLYKIAASSNLLLLFMLNIRFAVARARNYHYFLVHKYDNFKFSEWLHWRMKFQSIWIKWLSNWIHFG